MKELNIKLRNDLKFKECRTAIDDRLQLVVEDWGRWAVGYRNEIYRVLVMVSGQAFFEMTVHMFDGQPTLTGVEFKGESLDETHPKFSPLMQMYGPKLIEALN